MTNPPAIFIKLYDQAKAIARDEEERKSKRETSEQKEIFRNKLVKRISYEALVSKLAARVETLPEFSALQRELLPQGLGTKCIGTIKGGEFIEATEDTLIAIESVQTVFEHLGFYHDLLSGVEAGAIWSRIHAALNDKPIKVTTLLRLLGCDFTHEFGFLGYSVARISQEQLLHYGSRGRARLAALHPEFESMPMLDESWYLAKTKTVDSTTVAYPYRPPKSRDEILDKFWLPLFVLALCHSGAFNVSEVSMSIPGWDIKTVTLLDPSADDQPWSMYLKPHKQMEDWPEWSDEFYGIREGEWASFNTFRKMVTLALTKVVKGKSWDRQNLYRTSRWYLRDRMSDHPELTEDQYSDVLLYYVTCLENLMMRSDERGTIGDKLKVRVAWLVGRNDRERAAVSEIVRKFYAARSATVHHAPKDKKGLKNKQLDFLRSRDICRRAIAATLLVLGGKWKGDLDSFLEALPISQTAQDLAEKAATKTGAFTRCY